MTQNRSVWTFDPIDPEGWQTSHRRVLLLAAEPNGGNPNGGVQDMGHWFRAAPGHNFFSAWPFYSHSAAYAAAAGGGKEAFRHDNCLTRDNAPAFRDALKAARFADLKHTGGGTTAKEAEVRAAVEANLEQVLRLWIPQGEHPAPHVTVLLGNVAQTVFVKCVLPRLRAEPKRVCGTYVGFPHPSHAIDHTALRTALRAVASNEVVFEGGPALRCMMKRGLRWRYPANGWSWLEGT
jgi:hypothetical protein